VVQSGGTPWLGKMARYWHLALGDQSAMAPRNELPTDRPLYRFVRLSLYNSIFTNYAIMEALLLPDGDFTNMMFSLTHAGLMKCHDVMHKGEFRAVLMDLARD
jgi:hypothetical protein